MKVFLAFVWYAFVAVLITAGAVGVCPLVGFWPALAYLLVLSVINFITLHLNLWY